MVQFLNLLFVLCFRDLAGHINEIYKSTGLNDITWHLLFFENFSKNDWNSFSKRKNFEKFLHTVFVCKQKLISDQIFPSFFKKCQKHCKNWVKTFQQQTVTHGCRKIEKNRFYWSVLFPLRYLNFLIQISNQATR